MQNFESSLNLPGIQIDNVEILDNEVIIKCSSSFNEAICPKCKEKCVRVPKYYVRTVKDLQIFGKQTILKLTVRQFKCECHNYFNESFIFAAPKFLMTERYKEYIYKNCQGRDIKRVAEQENLSWHTVNKIYKSYVKKKQ
jgi:transposase